MTNPNPKAVAVHSDNQRRVVVRSDKHTINTMIKFFCVLVVFVLLVSITSLGVLR
jgi:hypothetical protein